MATLAIKPRVPEDLWPGTKDADRAAPPMVLPAEKAPDDYLPVSSGNEATSAMPQEIKFGALRSPLLRLLKPIPLRTEKREGTVSVVWDDITEFGYGDTLSEAIFDFSATLSELFKTLSGQQSLSDDLLEVKNKLSEYIEPRPR